MILGLWYDDYHIIVVFINNERLILIVKKISITIPEKMDEKVNALCKEFNLNKSRFIRELYDNFIFLYDFMELYMIPDNKKTPAIDDLKKIKHLDKIRKWV